MANGADRRLFWAAAAAVLVADVVTKVVAETLLARHLPVPVIGEYVQLRLVYNQCAAFGLCLGSYSRWIFFGLALLALVVLRSMVLATPPLSSRMASPGPAGSGPASSPTSASARAAGHCAPPHGWSAARSSRSRSRPTRRPPGAMPPLTTR